MIKTESITKKFGDFVALDNISCTIPSSCVYGLVGSNGAGKSTFLRVLSGVYKADSGMLMLDDEPIYDNSISKENIVFVSDDMYFLSGANLKRMAYDFYISEKYKRSIAYINECFVDKRRKKVDEIINVIKNFDSYNGYKVSVDIALNNEETGGLYSDLEKEKIRKIDPEKLKNELYDTLPSIPKSRDYDCMSVSVSNGSEWSYSYFFGISDESDIPDEIKKILETD